MSARGFESNKIINANVLIGLTRKIEIDRRPKLSRFRQLVSAFLIMTLLAVSVPAALEVVVNGAKQTAQDVRFAWLSGSFAIDSPWSFFAAFLKPRASSPSSVVTRIEVFPGAKTVRQGEQITFAAVGYDSQNEIVNGIGFRWQVADIGRNLPTRPLINSTFDGKVHGTFRVTATHENLQAYAEVTVTPLPSGSSTSSVMSSEPISISTRNSKTVSGKGDEENNAQLNPGEGIWNNENWPSSDDPGNQTGNPPGSPADGGAGNGNFQLSAPVISLPGRGVDLALNLNYNSRLWNKSGNELTYDIDRGFPAPGWSLGFGKIMDMGASGGSMLIDADGTRHGYAGTLYPGGWCGGWTGCSSFQGHTSDGKFIDYYSRRDPNGIYQAWAYLANGIYISYGAKGNNAVYPTYIRDANGNFITITYRNNQGPSIETITDTLGRVITFQYDSLGRFISAKAPRMQDEDQIYGGGKTRTLVKVHYKPLTLGYSFASGITPMVREATVNVIDAIYYPATNTGYWFNDTDSYSSYGMISKVVEQRGMSWATGADEQGVVTAGTMTKKADYNFPLTTANESGRTNGLMLSDAPTYENLKERWANRDVEDDVVTTYKIQQDTSPRVTTVIQPNGSVSRQFAYNAPNQFNDGLVYADETYVPDPNGTFTLPNVSGTFNRVGQSNVTWAPGAYS